MAQIVEMDSPNGPVSFRATDDYRVTGRGRIVCISPPKKADETIRVGDRVKIDGIPHRVSGIEISRGLTDPPVTLGVGLVVSPVVKSPGL